MIDNFMKGKRKIPSITEHLQHHAIPIFLLLKERWENSYYIGIKPHKGLRALSRPG